MIARQNKELRQTHDKILMSGGLFDAMLFLTKIQFFGQKSRFGHFWGQFLQKRESGDKNDALSPFLEKFTNLKKTLQASIRIFDRVCLGSQTSRVGPSGPCGENGPFCLSPCAG